MGVTRALCYAAAIAACWPGPPAAAQAAPNSIKTGNDYLATCTSADDADALICIVFTYGFTTGFKAGGYAQQIKRGDVVRDDLYCSPDGVTQGQIKDIAIAYLREHPETRHELIEMLLYQALRRAFPCPKK